MKERLLKIGDHILPMVLTALAAAGLTFAQTLASKSGFCPATSEKILEGGMLGAAFKGLHSISLIVRK